MGAIVAGQTSVKAPEREAFEEYLPTDVHIVSCHSLHGPSISPFGQPLALIHHRGPTTALTLVESILKPFRSRFVYMTFEEHDNITANTQAVTHAAFLSMGTAWHNDCEYPWEVPQGRYSGGIETVKVNITHRIYSNKWHVYAGLAILNPSAKVQIEQFAKSATELFKLILDKNESGLRKRVYEAREKVFLQNASVNARPILLSESRRIFAHRFWPGWRGNDHSSHHSVTLIKVQFASVLACDGGLLGGSIHQSISTSLRSRHSDLPNVDRSCRISLSGRGPT